MDEALGSFYKSHLWVTHTSCGSLESTSIDWTQRENPTSSSQGEITDTVEEIKAALRMKGNRLEISSSES